MIQQYWWVLPVLIFAYVFSWRVTRPFKGDARGCAFVFLTTFISLLACFLFPPWFGDFEKGPSLGNALLCSLLLAGMIAFTTVARFPAKEEKSPEDALRDGDVERIKELLVSDPKIVHMKGDYRETPLHWAAERGDVETIELLLTNGAKVDARDRANRETPLNWAACKGHTEAVRALVDGGADVNARNKDGETALHWAAYWGHEETVEALLHREADLNVKDEDGKTPLDWAVAENREGIARILVRYGAASGLNHGENGGDGKHGRRSQDHLA